jgi:NADPH:quinone reductase-like Zn-dependent oxidoreductase
MNISGAGRSRERIVKNIMRAVLVTPNAPGKLALGDATEPVPAPSEALVRVVALSLNRGEVRAAQSAAAGSRLGWDFTGTVERAAADGSGPPEGARVVGMLEQGAWAERVAVPSEALAVLPEAVSLAQAATLPVAGLTALYALERHGSLIGRRVLMTGASGGVGIFACQLARLGGASRVVGVVHQAAHAAAVREAGAHEVVSGEDTSPAQPFGPYDIILESVGGASLASALTLLAHDGTCVSFGRSSGSDSTIDVPRFFLNGGSTLYGFLIFHEVQRQPAGQGLARLAGLVATGMLRTRIEVDVPWTEIGSVAERLLARDFTGKAVLHVGTG